MSVKTKKYYCKNDGCTNQISYTGWKHGSGQCRPCANKQHSIWMKGKKFSLKHGKCSVPRFCLDCGIRISFNGIRCKSCSKKFKYKNDITSHPTYNKWERARRKEQIKNLIKLVENVKFKKQLAYFYWVEKKSLRQIGVIYEKNPGSIKYYMERFKISRRNLVEANLGKKLDEDTKRKISLANRAESNPMYGRKRPDIVEMNKKRTGINNPSFGKFRNDETKRKMSLSQGGTGIPYENTEYGKEFNPELRKKILKRDNYTCQNCAMTEIEHLAIYNRALEIHHIDYDKKRSVETNLITLCKQCHCRTNFKRDYWKVFFLRNIKNVIRIGKN